MLKVLCLHNNLTLPDVGMWKLKKAQILDVLEGFLKKKQAQLTAVPLKFPSSAEPAEAPLPISDEYIEDLIAVSHKQANERQPNQWAVGDDMIHSKELNIWHHQAILVKPDSACNPKGNLYPKLVWSAAIDLEPVAMIPVQDLA
ncbi:hypothetical protein PILCRDRAFT_88410 [Piloderma croceum F 1598]|uniref:Uncharacterized protein n=1 Tax=Piloderma croceum (strain F 1598) TaxID=765440 RepID=A0A0C3FE87_PILCF|nr:hypothetical protein PILCRDRAFT_88410 [Piloderma croceum F 1598]